MSEPPRERGEELLRRLEGRRWIGFEESMRANVRAFILSEVVVRWLLGLFSWYGYILLLSLDF